MRKNKVKLAKKTLKNNDLIKMFNQMVGEGELNMSIVIPKYELILKHLGKIEELFRMVFSPSALPPYVYSNYNNGVNDFILFADRIEQEIHECTLESNIGRLSNKDIEKLNQNQRQEYFMEFIHKVDNKYDHDELKEVYTRLKQGELTGDLIIAGRDIKELLKENMEEGESHDLENKHNLKSDFILNCLSTNLTLVPSISILDFKLLFIDDIVSEKFKARLLLMLHMFYKHVFIIIDQITKPDIDISEFSTAFVENIENIQNIPELKNCSKAFKLISQSVGLLEDNFCDYYKDFVANKNPASIIESFVKDVATDSNVDTSTTLQFKKIISYYKSKMKNYNDPGINKMLDLVQQNIQVLEE